MSNYKGRTIIFLEGVYEKCYSANTFFLNIYVSANIFFKHIRLCKYFFKHIRLRSANIFFQHHLRANNFFPFFNCHSRISFLQEIFSYFQICYLLKTEWPLFNAQSVSIFILMPQFVILFFISVLVEIFLISYLTSLQTFFLTLSRLQTIYFLFSDPENNFFLTFLMIIPALQKKMVRMLV